MTVTFDDAARVVLDRMRIALPAVTFAHDVPIPRPDRFVRIFRTGGPRATLVTDGAQLTIESWALDSATAADQAETVRAAINALPDLRGTSPQIYLVTEISGPGELPDPVSTSRRFTWSVSVHLRGH